VFYRQAFRVFVQTVPDMIDDPLRTVVDDPLTSFCARKIIRRKLVQVIECPLPLISLLTVVPFHKGRECQRNEFVQVLEIVGRERKLDSSLLRDRTMCSATHALARNDLQRRIQNFLPRLLTAFAGSPTIEAYHCVIGHSRSFSQNSTSLNIDRRSTLAGHRQPLSPELRLSA